MAARDDGADLGIGLRTVGQQGRERRFGRDPAQSPGRRAPDHGVRIVQPSDQGRHRLGRRLAAPSQHQRGVAQQAATSGSCQGRPLDRSGEGRRLALEPVDEVGAGPLGRRIELGHPSRRRLAVPGADVLADVAAEDPVAEPIGDRLVDRPFVLDGPVADTAAGVEPVRAVEGVGGTGVETPRAGAAMSPIVGRVRPQVRVHQQRPQHGEATQTTVNQHGVLADPAQPGEPAEITLQKRRGVSHRPAAHAGTGILQPLHQRVEPTPEDLVIIGPPRIRARSCPVGWSSSPWRARAVHRPD